VVGSPGVGSSGVAVAGSSGVGDAVGLPPGEVGVAVASGRCVGEAVSCAPGDDRSGGRCDWVPRISGGRGSPAASLASAGPSAPDTGGLGRAEDVGDSGAVTPGSLSDTSGGPTIVPTT
jgi:hypothetical protein